MERLGKMKRLKRTPMWMAKEHSMYRRDEENLVYNSKDEKTYLTENGIVSFYYNKEGYVRGMYKVENGKETYYEAKL